MPVVSPSARYLAVMPAAGTGSRVGATLPKQYLDIGGQTMIARTARTLVDTPWVEALAVIVAPQDQRAAGALGRMPRCGLFATGGATRRDTVLAGLVALRERYAAADNDWVLVHDAARPGLDRASLDRLRTELEDDSCGGLLALPVSDTVKTSSPGAPPRVSGTLAREALWLAQTPQMFRYSILRDALERFPDVTDEAAAVEQAGFPVRLVAGSRVNFKVTTADDLDAMRRLVAGR
jgi:2-C-methyl-D-erythritol 4-phosphate cytidylyltransferase